MHAHFNGLALAMTLAQAQSASHRGDCTHSVLHLSREPSIARQLRKLNAVAVRMELEQYGAWNSAELNDDAENLQRVVWLAACDIAEDVHTLAQERDYRRAVRRADRARARLAKSVERYCERNHTGYRPVTYRIGSLQVTA